MKYLNTNINLFNHNQKSNNFISNYIRENHFEEIERNIKTTSVKIRINNTPKKILKENYDGLILGNNINNEFKNKNYFNQKNDLLKTKIVKSNEHLEVLISPKRYSSFQIFNNLSNMFNKNSSHKNTSSEYSIKVNRKDIFIKTINSRIRKNSSTTKENSISERKSFSINSSKIDYINNKSVQFKNKNLTKNKKIRSNSFLVSSHKNNSNEYKSQNKSKTESQIKNICLKKKTISQNLNYQYSIKYFDYILRRKISFFKRYFFHKLKKIYILKKKKKSNSIQKVNSINLKNKKNHIIVSKSKSPFKYLTNKSTKKSINKKENNIKFKTIIKKYILSINEKKTLFLLYYLNKWRNSIKKYLKDNRIIINKIHYRSNSNNRENIKIRPNKTKYELILKHYIIKYIKKTKIKLFKYIIEKLKNFQIKNLYGGINLKYILLIQRLFRKHYKNK